MDLTTIRVRTPYLHGGERLHPKLLAAVPADVAAGMVALGIADAEAGDPDVTLPHLTWDAATRRNDGKIAPASVGHEG